jgi:hypothetical protein
VSRAARVVIDIRRAPTDPAFVEGVPIMALDPVAAVAQAVAARQSTFVAALDRTFDPLLRRDLRVLDVLTLQCSIVAELSDVRTLLALAQRSVSSSANLKGRGELHGPQILRAPRGFAALAAQGGSSQRRHAPDCRQLGGLHRALGRRGDARRHRRPVRQTLPHAVSFR